MPPNDPRHTLSGVETRFGADLAPGRLLNANFELIEPIGRGGMGQVWKANDKAGHRSVAVKLLPSELRNHEDAIQLVRESFQKVHSLNHQHIGKSLAMLSDLVFGPFIVMDLVPGIPLSRYAKKYRQQKGQIPVSHVVKFLRPVAQALDYAHARGVLHRDVKPENILVQIKPYFEVTLIDFGLAATIRSTMTRFTQASTDTSGTRPYMSPEQLRGKRQEWDGRTDQYSLAVVAYELLSGHLPFETEDDFALMYAVLNEPVTPIEGCSESVNRALLRGLGKDKSDRFDKCELFVDSLSEDRVEAVRISTPKAAVPDASPKTFVNSIGMNLVLIPAGNFMMGSPESDSKAPSDEKPQHRVTISRPFYLGATVVTQGQWKSVMGTEPWRGNIFVKEGANYPATDVSWDDPVAFCKKLSVSEGRQYRLPTEAEWEYACRGGTSTQYSFGDDESDLGLYAWFGDNAEGHAHSVKQKRANPFGLYDMHGNVWEWCNDWYGDYSGSSVTDPVGPSRGLERVGRGGGWYTDARFCHSANRHGGSPSDRKSPVGFRVAMTFEITRPE